MLLGLLSRESLQRSQTSQGLLVIRLVEGVVLDDAHLKGIRYLEGEVPNGKVEAEKSRREERERKERFKGLVDFQV